MPLNIIYCNVLDKLNVLVFLFQILVLQKEQMCCSNTCFVSFVLPCGHWITELEQHWNTWVYTYVIVVCPSWDTETNLKLPLSKLKVNCDKCSFWPEEQILFSTSIRLTWMSSHFCKHYWAVVYFCEGGGVWS